MPEEHENRPAGTPLRAEGIDALDKSVPWRNPALLPEKPGGYLYGVKFKNHPKHGDSDQPCGTGEELLRQLDAADSRIDKVYLPEEERGVPKLSLNCFPPHTKKDYWRHFLRVLKTNGFLGGAAIVGAVYMNSAASATLFILGLLFGIIPVFDTFLQWLLYPGNRSTNQLKQSLVHGLVFTDWIENSRKPRIAAWILVLVFVIVFGGQMQEGRGQAFNRLIELGSIHPTPVRQGGEWWRLFTGTLMHGDISIFLHIGFNSLGLVYLGKFIHRLTNPLIVPIVFVVSAFIGAIASVMFWGDRVGIGSVGASGGVVGMLGFLAYLVFANPGVFPREFRTLTVRNIILLTILGVAGYAFIDNAGHGGGLIGGILCGLIYGLFHRKQWDVPASPVTIGLATASFSIVLFGLLTCLDLFFFEGRFLVAHLPLLRW